MIKYAMKIFEFEFSYELQKALKVQTLTDFTTETISDEP